MDQKIEIYKAYIGVNKLDTVLDALIKQGVRENFSLLTLDTDQGHLLF